jgi:hypothetical protein
LGFVFLYTGVGTPKRGPEGRVVEHARRPRQAVMLAQHCPGIFGPEQPALLQDRDHLGAEHVELCRQQWRHDVEPIRGPVGEPVLDQAGNLFRCPGRNEMLNSLLPRPPFCRG